MQDLSEQEVKELVKLRKVALQNLNITLTQRLNDELEKNAEFSKLFISKEFLREIFNLNGKVMETIAGIYGLNIKLIPSLYLHNRQNGFILGLSEEKEYLEEEYKRAKKEERMQKKKELEKIAISEHLDLQIDLPINKRIAKKSLTEEEIEQIKLQSIVSTDVRERIKALRTAIYLPIPNKDKVYILTRAISEDDPKVKLEAIGFLRYFGIRPHIVEIFKELTSQKDPERKLALDTLISMADKLENFEKIILVILILSFLKFENNPKFINSGFELSEKVIDKIVKNVEWILTLTRIIIEKLSDNFYVFSDSSYKLLRKIIESSTFEVQDIVFNELHTIPVKNIRGLFLEVFSNVATLSEEKRAVLVEKIFYELKDWDDTRFECRKLGNCIVKFGITALNFITKNFEQVSAGQKQFFIRLIASITKMLTMDEKTKEFLSGRFFQFIRNLILKSNKQEFMTILEENIVLILPVANEFKVKLAVLMLLRSGEFLNERIMDLILIMFSKLDVNVIDVLYKNYTENFDTNIKKVILKILINTKDRYDYARDKKTVDRFIKTLDGDYGLYNELKEIILNSLGALHSIKNMDIDKIASFSSFLKSELPKSKVPWAVIETFSYLATSDSTPVHIILDIANILISILHSPMPDIKMDEVKIKDSTMYKIYGSVKIFTDLIPSTILGLEKIALNNKISDTFRYGIFDVLVKKYLALSDFKDVWGPNSISTLIRAIKNIATSKQFPASGRLEVLKNFSKSSMTLALCETICDILNCVELNEANEYYFEYYIGKILDELQKLKDAGDYDSIYYISRYLSKLLRKDNLSLNSKKNRYLKEKVVTLFLRFYNENIIGIYNVLYEIEEMKNLPPHLSKLIKIKISK